VITLSPSILTYSSEYLELSSNDMSTSRSSDGWATANDWANHRPFITSLYRDQNVTLKETMQVMEERHDFYAT
jgi:hypothetical protein